jgi:hypothetical protein
MMTQERTDADRTAEMDVIAALMDCYNPAPLRNATPADRWEDDANKDTAARLPVTCYDD